MGFLDKIKALMKKEEEAEQAPPEEEKKAEINLDEEMLGNGIEMGPREENAMEGLFQIAEKEEDDKKEEK